MVLVVVFVLPRLLEQVEAVAKPLLVPIKKTTLRSTKTTTGQPERKNTKQKTEQKAKEHCLGRSPFRARAEKTGWGLCFFLVCSYFNHEAQYALKIR